MPSTVATSRRRLLELATGATALGLAGCTAIRRYASQLGANGTCSTYDQPFPEAWPMEGYDSSHTRANPNAAGPKSNVAVDWIDGGHGFVRTAPVVAGDAVYLHGHPNQLVAFSTGTGETRWTFEMGARPGSDTEVSHPPAYSTPTVVGDTVYVGGGNVEFRATDGETTHVADHLYLYAIDRASGEVRWRLRTDERVHTAPVAVGDTLVFATQDGTVHAVDADEREIDWTFSDVDQPGGPVPTPAVADCTAYLNTPEEGLFALDVRDGQLRWRVPEVRSASAPAVVGGTVYVGSMDGKLLAIDGEEGTVRWTYRSGGTTAVSSPAIADGVVVVGDTSGESGVPAPRIHAVDADTGEGIWTVETEAYVRATPAIADGVAYVAAGNDVFGIDLEDGEELWHRQTDWPVFAPLSVTGQGVYAATDNGHLYAFAEESSG